MKVKINIMPHRVLIEEKVFTEKTRGGIIIPTTKLEQYQAMACEGKIVSMSDDAFTGDVFASMPENKKPKIGQIVHFKKYDGEGYSFNEKPYRLILDELINFWTEDYFNDKEDEIC